MKKYFTLYKPFLVFLGKFLLTYLVLTFAYESYLSQFDAKKFEVDGFTQLVARQTVGVLRFFGGNANFEKNFTEPSINIIYNHQFISRIIEGCNAMSVIILFVAFVIAFSGKPKITVLYLVGGSLIIHVLNISRIALLSVLMFYFPEYQHFLHGVVFPMIIYGVVFVLWVVWVNKFSSYAKK